MQQPIKQDLTAALRLLNPDLPDGLTPFAAWVAVRPKCPAGMRFSKNSFWSVLESGLPYRANAMLFVLVAWIHARHDQARKAGSEWPPKPTFQPIAHQPIPWTGKDENPGRVPWTGKK